MPEAPNHLICNDRLPGYVNSKKRGYKLKILILGIGNILFGDEGIGPHLANLIHKKYEFTSDEHEVCIMDGGTLAQRLITIITEFDRVIILDCVKVDDADIGDVYSFDFDKVPDCIAWNGSAHEVEMLQTLQMIDMMGDLPPVHIIGVIPSVIGENTTFMLTEEIKEASITMENEAIKYLESISIKVKEKRNITVGDVLGNTYAASHGERSEGSVCSPQ
ncbi:HyaD/HybD family hydrogenase maturation endopeptidase [Thiolapillus sp.]